MLTESFESEHSLAIAKNLDETIQFLKFNEYDIILLDLNLPDSSRLNTFYSIKPFIDITPVVVLTGLKEDDIGIKSISEGAQDYLNKGEFDAKMLKRAIVYAMKRKTIEFKLVKSELRHKALSQFSQSLIFQESETPDNIGKSLKCILDVTDTLSALVYENIPLTDNRIYAQCVYRSENIDKAAAKNVSLIDFQIPGFEKWYPELSAHKCLFICKKKATEFENDFLDTLKADCSIVVPIIPAAENFYGFMCFTFEKHPVEEILNDDIQIFQTVSNLLGTYLVKKSLEKETLQLVEKLKKANDELKELTKMKEDFIAVAGHDIRSPFVGIIGFSNILLSEPDLPEKYKDIIKIILKSAEIQLRYVNDLIDIIKLESREITLKKESYSIANIIEESLRFLLPLAVNKNISVKTNINADMRILVDYPKIIQVLNNLISNAIKFTPQGKSIELTADIKNNFVEIHVRDTGMGIPESRLANIFNRLKHISSQGTDGEKGTGLGLSICKNIVEIHGGKISVNSTVGKGSDFWFTLPLS